MRKTLPQIHSVRPRIYPAALGIVRVRVDEPRSYEGTADVRDLDVLSHRACCARTRTHHAPLPHENRRIPNGWLVRVQESAADKRYRVRRRALRAEPRGGGGPDGMMAASERQGRDRDEWHRYMERHGRAAPAAAVVSGARARAQSSTAIACHRQSVRRTVGTITCA
ncbi:hypothetical protein BH23GEM6_BH23GEM6_14740 [soil metagenome]